ncbi:uncharacterized protein BDV14DRAFT_69521 [Aspergillus stella-maris]|uniref:uncharacterized protein n=1 Tax=Aspergillus stella-maris TaxID=1810926 RepID=UPI003CCCAB61
MRRNVCRTFPDSLSIRISGSSTSISSLPRVSLTADGQSKVMYRLQIMKDGFLDAKGAKTKSAEKCAIRTITPAPPVLLFFPLSAHPPSESTRPGDSSDVGVELPHGRYSRSLQPWCLPRLNSALDLTILYSVCPRIPFPGIRPKKQTYSMKTKSRGGANPVGRSATSVWGDCPHCFVVRESSDQLSLSLTPTQSNKSNVPSRGQPHNLLTVDRVHHLI